MNRRTNAEPNPDAPGGPHADAVHKFQVAYDRALAEATAAAYERAAQRIERLRDVTYMWPQEKDALRVAAACVRALAKG